MGRQTKLNSITDKESLLLVNPENTRLKNDFLSYLKSTQKSEKTIYVYGNDLDIFFVWNLKNNNNKLFSNITKRDLVSYQNWLLNENGNSPARVRRLKATLSSLSNYIENICDDDPEFKNFKSIVKKIENPINQPVREKTIFTDDELDALLNLLVSNNQMEKACMLALAMCSGRRKSELVRFKVSYFDEENIVFNSLYKTPEKIKTKGRGAGKMLNCYTFVNKFTPYLNLWLEQRKFLNIDSEWLFPDSLDRSKHCKDSKLNSWAISFSKILNKDFYWHSLRHYFTTHLVRMGLPEMFIQEIIGWDSAEMLRLYTDISIEEQIGMFFKDGEIKEIKKSSLSDF